MIIRKAIVSDKTALFMLYREVARTSSGIARIEEEITESYIESLFENVSKEGIMLLAVEEAGLVIGEIHASKYGIRIFDHILTNLTIVVHPAAQGKGVGKSLFKAFLADVRQNRPEILRVELESRSSNSKSIGLYKSMGFVQEGQMRNKTRNRDGSFEDSILMAWSNPNFKA